MLHETDAKDNLSGTATLKEAIEYQYSVGIYYLPFVYSSYFIIPFDQYPL